MLRASLAEEFGIKKIHFVPVPGGVLEYGTPSGEEVVLINLMGSLIPEMLRSGSPGRFFKLLGELFLCLRLLVTIEEQNLVSGVRKTVASFLNSVNEVEIKLASSKRNVVSHIALFALRGLMTLLSPIVWALSYFVDVEKRRQKRRQAAREKEFYGADMQFESTAHAFETADQSGNGKLTYAEFEQAFGALLKETSVQPIWREFDNMDLDKNGEIDFEEFSAKEIPWLKIRPKST